MRYHVSVLLTAVLAACGQAPEQSSFSKRDVRDNAIVSGVAAPDAILNVGTITFRSSPDDPWVWGGCSGTLVAKNVFVTAGHCLFGGEEADAAGIQFGVTFAPRTRPIPPDARVFAGKVHVHPDFVVPTDPLELGLDPDVAVVVLDSPATHVHPAELPPADLFSKDTHEFANRTFGIAGYGRTNFAIFDGGVRRYSTMKF